MTLPDRVTVPTCIGCGAMGRAQRCEADRSERALVLVHGADHVALLAIGRAARLRAGGLEPVARRLAGAGAPSPDEIERALGDLRAAARRALRDTGGDAGLDRPAPATVTGWWCAECGNVDLPRPCIGVCVWRREPWVSVALYERDLDRVGHDLDAAYALTATLRRPAGVTPRAGRWERNWRALSAGARTALAPAGTAA